MFHVKERLAQTCHTEAELTLDYGNHSLAFFGLAPQNLHFLAPDGAGLVNYRLTNNVAVVLGDPVCVPEALEHVTRSFLDFCTLHHWPVAFYQASSAHLATYHTLKLRVFKMGEEAIIHPQTFTLDGSAMANVRTSSRRTEREGVIIHWYIMPRLNWLREIACRTEREGVIIHWYEGVPPAEVMQQLSHLSHAWLEHKAGKQASETGFSTGSLDELIHSAEQADTIANISTTSHAFHLPTPRFVTGVATTSSGQACAFVTFTPIYGSLIAEASATSANLEKNPNKYV